MCGANALHTLKYKRKTMDKKKLIWMIGIFVVAILLTISWAYIISIKIVDYGNQAYITGFNNGQSSIIADQTINRKVYYFQDNRTQDISINKLCGFEE